jgi:hypothetical protein
MRAAGQVGQFNHPDTSGQFIINGTDFGYTPTVTRSWCWPRSPTPAPSPTRPTSPSSRARATSAFRKILERGFHVAPATNQDNHCANWGASYTNRTAVLIPNGTALTKASFVDALRARRVFATHDKNSQLVFSANGAIMGSRINNSGVLNLNVGFANTAGRPCRWWRSGRACRAQRHHDRADQQRHYSHTPTDGAHVYYAKLTQDDGKILWSAPIWVNQGAANNGDTTPPTVSASQTGNSGTITLSATAATTSA